MKGLTLRLAACRYAKCVADTTTTHAERVKAWEELEHAASAHVWGDDERSRIEERLHAEGLDQLERAAGPLT